MADNDSVFEFHLEVADLTEIRRKDSTLDRELPYTQKPIAEDSHLEALRSVDDLIIRLDDLGVPGPLTVDPSPRKHLGEGGQFIVYEGSLLDPSTSCETETETEAVAIKTPKFGVFPDGQLDLTSSTSRRQINDFYLEVVALRNQALLNSRNVVQLLGWTVAQTIHQTPSLVFELALGTMASIFEGPEITWHIKHQLCLDVGNGLDAIHKAGIIHSDLRPQNALIFRAGSWDTPLVAKLADFGASEAEQGAEGDTVMEVKGLSYDWSAPEISLNARVTMSQMLKADVFSWGLLVLSFSCLKGAAPSCKESDAAASIVRETAGISASYLVLLTTALPLLLHPNPAERPQEVGHLLVDESEACEMWRRDEADRVFYYPPPRPGPFVHPWKMPSLSAYLFLGLETSFNRRSAQISGPHLLAMFLLKSHSDTSKEDKSAQLAMLKASAEKGHIPAQAIIERVHKSYGVAFVGPNHYLANGAATGSIYATLDLAARDQQSADAARMRFLQDTGYNQFFSPLPASFNTSQDTTDADGNTILHRLSAKGNTAQLREALRDQGVKTGLDSQNRHGETALYKACLAGCWQTVSLLCDHGANAFIPSDLNGLTCLHWLFNFPHERIDEVAKTLLRSGANVNATTDSDPTAALIDYHFPFQWPLGTPLHSAVHARNHAAVRALISYGADASIRDVRDPYLTDLNVRQMHIHGTTETGETSRPNHVPLGFTPVDLAAALHDGEILELLASEGREQTPTLCRATDEEGYAPFHRLSYLRVGRTSDGLRFWYPALRGSAAHCEAQIAKTIRVLQRLGGNINQLTNTPGRPALQGVSGLTPLMIAVSKADCEGTSALLKAGAEVNHVNRDGTSALMCLPHASDQHVTTGSLLRLVHTLLSHKANVNLKSTDDTTPLIAAVSSDSMPCVQALIENRADPSASQRGFNIVASLIYHSGYLRQLASPDAKSRDEAERKEQAIVQILGRVCSDEHAWAHQVDMDNGSLLHYAASAGLTDCVKTLVRAGFDRKQQRKLHFKGPLPSYYDSLPGLVTGRQLGTPSDITCQAVADLATRGMHRISEQDSDYVRRKYLAIKVLLEV